MVAVQPGQYHDADRSVRRSLRHGRPSRAVGAALGRSTALVNPVVGAPGESRAITDEAGLLLRPRFTPSRTRGDGSALLARMTAEVSGTGKYGRRTRSVGVSAERSDGCGSWCRRGDSNCQISSRAMISRLGLFDAPLARTDLPRWYWSCRLVRGSSLASG